MRTYLLDTNHASMLYRKNAALRARVGAQGNAVFHLCAPVVGELWYMVCHSVRRDQNAAEMEAFLRSYVAWPYGDKEARAFGAIKAGLRAMGRPIPDVDTQIAATALVHQWVLLSADAHFHHVQGLQVENWLI